MKDNVVLLHNKEGWLVDHINEMHETGQIKGMVVAILSTDGEMHVGISNELAHIEKLGLASQLEEDIKNQARVITYE